METREELAKADRKASLLLAALGVAIAVLIGAVSGGAPDPRRFGTLGQVFFWAGCAAALSLLALGAAALPRTRHLAGGRVHYFGDVARGAMSARQIRDLLDLSDPVERDIEQFAVLAGSVSNKYRWIRLGMLSGLAFLALTLLGALLGAGG